MNRLFQADPDKARPYLLQRLQLELLFQNRKPEEQREWGLAESLAREAMEQKNISTELKGALVAEYYRLRGDTKRAEAIMRDVESRTEGTLVTELAAAKRQIYQSEPAKTTEALEALQKKYGDILAVRLLRAEALLRARPEDLLERMKQLEETPNSYSEAERLQLWSELGNYYLFAGHSEDARRLWEKVLAAAPDNVGLRLQLFELALNSKDDQKIAQALKRIESKFTRESPEWKWASAAVTLIRVRDKKDDPAELENAIALVDDAISKRPTWSMLFSLRGDLEILQKRPDLAIVSLEKALELGSVNPIVLRNLARIYYERTRYADARRILDQLPPTLWEEYENRIHLHLLAMNQELPKDLKIDGAASNAEGYTWLGQLLSDAKRFDEATTSYRKALELDKEHPGAWSGLVLNRIRQGDKEGATKLLEEARDEIAARSQPSFLAVMYRMLGDFPNAEKYYLKTLETAGDDLAVRRDVATFYVENKKIDEVQSQLDRILRDAQPHADSPHPSIPWARRLRAELMAQDGTFESYRKAIAMIQENTPAGQTLSPEDLIVWSKLALSRHDYQTYADAVAQHVQAEEARGLGYQESIFLAELYNRLGNWTECQRVMTDLLIANPKEMAILDPWLRLLLEHDDLQGATQWVKNCPPGSLTAIRTQVHLDVRRRDSAAALEILKPIIDAPGAGPEKEQALIAVANIAEEVGKYDPTFVALADEIWRRAVKVNAQNLLNYAHFLGRSGDPNKASILDQLCTKIVEQGRIVEVLRPSISMLRRFGDKIPERSAFESKVRTWLEQAAKINPQAALMQRAELESVLGDFEGQARALREYLE
ncbi:MAG TPA: tetratricopeptide repeat protein, partial [Pirellulaceae bacterium]